MDYYHFSALFLSYSSSIFRLPSILKMILYLAKRTQNSVAQLLWSWNWINLHVTFHGENTITDSFRWHPPHWKSVMLTRSTIHSLCHGASSQTKVSHFDELLFTDQDVAGGQIPMNDILSWQVSLRKETWIINVDAYHLPMVNIRNS